MERVLEKKLPVKSHVRHTHTRTHNVQNSNTEKRAREDSLDCDQSICGGGGEAGRWGHESPSSHAQPIDAPQGSHGRNTALYSFTPVFALDCLPEGLLGHLGLRSTITGSGIVVKGSMDRAVLFSSLVNDYQPFVLFFHHCVTTHSFRCRPDET